MDQKEINIHLRNLEGICFSFLRTSSELSFDYFIRDDDYSKEYMFFELFRAVNNYDRAINTLQLKDELADRIDFIKQSAMETLSLEDHHIVERLMTFYKDYFSEKRYRGLIHEFQASMNFGSLNELPEDTADIMEDKILNLFEFRDHIIQLTDENSLFIDFIDSVGSDAGNSIETLSMLEKGICSEHDRHQGLWSLYSEAVNGHRETLFIPLNKKNEWWFVFKPITIPELKRAFDMEAASLHLEGMVNKISTKTPIIDKTKISVHNISDLIVDTLDRMGKKLNDVISPISPAAQAKSVDFSFYGLHTEERNEDEPVTSDHEIEGAAMYDNYHVNKQAIKQAIHVIESDKVDAQLKKETVAILFLLLHEDEKAFDRLNE